MSKITANRRAATRVTLTCLVATAALATPVVHAEAPLIASPTARVPRFAPVRPAGVPGDEELQAQGARIGAIRINSRPIFDAEAGDQETRFGRLANRLHIQTRDATLADQLLFRSGDLYDPRLIEESARILRSSEYLRDAWITPVSWHDGVVDLEVRAQDVWTLNPGLSVPGGQCLWIEITNNTNFPNSQCRWLWEFATDNGMTARHTPSCPALR